MKKLSVWLGSVALMATLLLRADPTVTPSNVLTWSDPNVPGTISGFVVSAATPSSTNAVRRMMISGTNAPLATLLAGQSNGVYNLNVITVGTNGLVSPPSTNLSVFWYQAVIPLAPYGLTLKP